MKAESAGSTQESLSDSTKQESPIPGTGITEFGVPTDAKAISPQTSLRNQNSTSNRHPISIALISIILGLLILTGALGYLLGFREGMIKTTAIYNELFTTLSSDTLAVDGPDVQ